MPKNELQINGEIKDPKVRLIDENGEQLGIMTIAKALEAAYAAGLDLVKVSPNPENPVCRIMDYGKYRFEQQKKQKEAKKNQNRMDIKEIKLSVGIGEHDYGFKLRAGRSFLEDGDKVKVSIRFRGREMAHTELGTEMLLRFADDCADLGAIEKQPKLEGRSVALFIAPKTSKLL